MLRIILAFSVVILLILLLGLFVLFLQNSGVIKISLITAYRGEYEIASVDLILIVLTALMILLTIITALGGFMVFGYEERSKSKIRSAASKVAKDLVISEIDQLSIDLKNYVNQEIDYRYNDQMVELTDLIRKHCMRRFDENEVKLNDSKEPGPNSVD